MQGNTCAHIYTLWWCYQIFLRRSDVLLTERILSYLLDGLPDRRAEVLRPILLNLTALEIVGLFCLTGNRRGE